jgi:xylulokinase
MSLLGIDVGTSGCKVAAFSLEGSCYGVEYCGYDMLDLEACNCELDSQNIWLIVKDTIREAVSKVPVADPVEALSVSSFGEAFVPVTKEKQILATSILSCDKRGAEYIESLKNFKDQDELYKINPNILSPNYSLPKLMWIKEYQPELYEHADYFLLWADFICFMLGSEVFTSNSLANRTLLFDFRRNNWSEQLLDWSGIDKEKLGQIVHGGQIVGSISSKIAKELGLSSDVKIVSGGHDQCLNALGSGCIFPGTATCGIGTYECITPVYSQIPEFNKMMSAGINVEHHVLPGLYVSFIFNQAGMLVKWFRNTFAGNENSNDIYSKLESEIPDKITDIFSFPYFEATGAPYYANGAKGGFIGLSASSSRGDIFKSLLEGISFYFVEPINNLKKLGISMERFIASGGGAKSNKWLQIKADIMGVPFVRPQFTECGTMGAAMLAGVATGIFSEKDAVEIYFKEDAVFEPDAKRNSRYTEKLQKYNNFPKIALS